MSQKQEFIDLTFGLSQLSGNHSLLVKLLGKFSMEYQDLPEKLIEMNSQENMVAYKQAVHTIKGVSGNLGLNALHHAAKALEADIISGTDHHANFLQFKSVLIETLSQIKALSAESEGTKEEDQPKDVANDGIEKLKGALERNQFIPPDELTSILSGCHFSDPLKEEISSAISDLDYPLALQLIESH